MDNEGLLRGVLETGDVIERVVGYLGLCWMDFSDSKTQWDKGPLRDEVFVVMFQF
jgi:hypothetical protein